MNTSDEKNSVVEPEEELFVQRALAKVERTVRFDTIKQILIVFPGAVHCDPGDRAAAGGYYGKTGGVDQPEYPVDPARDCGYQPQLRIRWMCRAMPWTTETSTTRIVRFLTQGNVSKDFFSTRHQLSSDAT
jgi:hypothetical protein